MDYRIFICDLFVCVHTRGTSVYSLIQRTAVWVCTEFDSGEISGKVGSRTNQKTLHIVCVTVTSEIMFLTPL